VHLPSGVPIPRKQNSTPLLIPNSRKASPLSALPSACGCKADHLLHQQCCDDSLSGHPSTPERQRTTTGWVLGAPQSPCRTQPPQRQEWRKGPLCVVLPAPLRDIGNSDQWGLLGRKVRATGECLSPPVSKLQSSVSHWHPISPIKAVS